MNSKQCIAFTRCYNEGYSITFRQFIFIYLIKYPQEVAKETVFLQKPIYINKEMMGQEPPYYLQVHKKINSCRKNRQSFTTFKNLSHTNLSELLFFIFFLFFCYEYRTA